MRMERLEDAINSPIPCELLYDTNVIETFTRSWSRARSRAQCKVSFPRDSPRQITRNSWMVS
jgi:hypothetical protein